MKQNRYQVILYFISSVITITLLMQLYWNYKNYLSEKQQLVNEVQISLDNAVDAYYTELAQEKVIDFSFSENGASVIKDSLSTFFSKFNRWDSLKQVEAKNDVVIRVNDSANDFESISIISSISTQLDSVFKNFNFSKNRKPINGVLRGNGHSLTNNPLNQLAAKVVYAISSDNINLKKIDTLFQEELQRKKIDVGYELIFKNPYSPYKLDKISNLQHLPENELSTFSKSNYLPRGTQLYLNFSNIVMEVLQRNFFGLLLSFVFVAAIIGCLLYLLKIIKDQKQLAEVKNDLISNITHEFKTPIATIGVAMEGIQNFNTNHDIKKSIRYAKISSEQVNKLHVMVEKLLETATLDSGVLPLKKELKNIVELLKRVSQKEDLAIGNKRLSFSTSAQEINCKVDVFHFENALNNIIDNALKYGGDDISIDIKTFKTKVEINISDNGASLTEEYKKHVFEKFYRVPKGNTHNVKGFGIGLYYTKKIIEKHQGVIWVTIRPNTVFTIQLPYYE